MNGIIHSEGLGLANKLMQLTMERQKFIANNIANANTPGYIRQDINFQDKLTSAIESGDANKISAIRGEAMKDYTNPTRRDGNNVIIPKEMGEMMENSVYYNLLSKAYSTKMKILKSAIKSQ